MDTEVVYVIGSPKARPVKIGRSSDVLQRLRAMQPTSPVPLQILWIASGDSQLEAALHRRFRKQRVHYEWFDFQGVDPIAEVIRGIAEITGSSAPSTATQAEVGRFVAELNAAEAKAARARLRLRGAEETARDAVAVALKAGFAERVTGFRAEVQRRSPFSAPVVRAIGEDNGVPPDERYVRTPKTTD